MPLTLIQGHYRILHTAPDGDSIRFYPDDPLAFQKAKLPVQTNNSGGAQLRLDGIDSLETHYRPRVGGLGMQHQPEHFAQAAALELLTFLGFSDVQRGASELVSSATPDQIQGYILTRFADKYGRGVAFVFKGQAPGADLSPFFLNVATLKRSANYHMLTKGLAYPTYYEQLYPDLRQAMTTAVVQARTSGHGLWPADQTTSGFTVQSLATITDDVVMLPKLFRRLLDYLAINDGSADLSGFPAFLAAKNDRLLILSTGHSTGFDFVLKVEGQQVTLITPPEDLVFREG